MADDRGSTEAEDEIKLASPEEGGKKKQQVHQPGWRPLPTWSRF